MKGPIVQANWVDRLVAVVAPRAAVSRLQARAAFGYLAGGGYTGARTDRRATRDWRPTAQSPDADTVPDLVELRARSSDLLRNAPLASGAIKTVATNVVGTGLLPHPRVDREALGMSAEAATAWNRKMKRLFRTIAKTTALDVAGRLTFFEQQHQAITAPLERGDVVVLRRENPSNALTRTAFQLVEADRLCNPLGEIERPNFTAGVESDPDGRIVNLHIASEHPDGYAGYGFRGVPTWTKIPATGPASGLPLAWIVGWMTRPGQTRGVPYLATVIEVLKQVERYGDAELMAAVISAMFTVFIKSDGDPLGPGVSPGTDPTSGQARPPEYKLGAGAIGRLLPGEDAIFANPTRPNAQFHPFIQAWGEQIGVALEIPYEILMKHFTSSYSAARGAQLEAWRHFWMRREWIATSFCHPIYEAVVAEAVAREWIEAPGFFDDPFLRLAYTQASWVGPEPGQIDPRAEVEAAAMRVEKRFSTLEEETQALTGGDWEENIEQLEREQEATARLRPVDVPAPAVAATPVVSPDERDTKEEETRQQQDRATRQTEGLAAVVAQTAAKVALDSMAVMRREERAADAQERERERARARQQAEASEAQHRELLSTFESAVVRMAERPVALPPMSITLETPRAGQKTMRLERNAAGELVAAHVVEEGVA